MRDAGIQLYHTHPYTEIMLMMQYLLRIIIRIEIIIWLLMCVSSSNAGIWNYLFLGIFMHFGIDVEWIHNNDNDCLKFTFYRCAWG